MQTKDRILSAVNALLEGKGTNLEVLVRDFCGSGVEVAVQNNAFSYTFYLHDNRLASSRIEVAESYRRQGIASNLVAVAERLAKQYGCLDAIAMQVNSPKAASFWEKQGYEYINCRDMYKKL